MRQFENVLSGLVRSIVLNPQDVTVKQIHTDPLAFEVLVSRADYDPVLSKLSALKTLAAVCSDLPEQTRVIVYLKPE